MKVDMPRGPESPCAPMKEPADEDFGALLAEYEKAGKGCMYTIHLGLGNNAGAVFSAIDMVCEANGLLAWEWMANYTLFRSRTTDTLDFTRETCRYQGDDIPESRIPKQERPPYAADRPDIESGAPSCVSC